MSGAYVRESHRTCGQADTAEKAQLRLAKDGESHGAFHQAETAEVKCSCVSTCSTVRVGGHMLHRLQGPHPFPLSSIPDDCCIPKLG